MSEDLELQQRRLRLKKSLKELSEMKGMGTELVTVVIPPEKMISDVRHQLGNEMGQTVISSQNQQRKTCYGRLGISHFIAQQVQDSGRRGNRHFRWTRHRGK